jgi:hypothetical protein
LAKRLVKEGHSVRVVTAHFGKIKKKELKDIELKQQELKKLEVKQKNLDDMIGI